MSISKTRLETWAKYQQLDVLTKTYNHVINTLEGFKPSDGLTYNNPYLQGSYGNSTHIYGKGDIDVVVELSSVFYSNLTPTGRSYLLGGSHDLDKFFNELYLYLVGIYGNERVETGSKTIKIKYEDGKKAVDIVACCYYKEFIDPDNSNSSYNLGIRLKNGNINFPKIHKANGEIKMSETDNMLKKYVRIFKNINKKLKNDDQYYNIIPSYFIECLLFNVPNSKFDTDLVIGFENILNWLNEIEAEDLKKFVTQSKLQYLFGLNSTQWNTCGFYSFISKVDDLNTNW
jgi:hypothetical protein